MPVPPEQAQIAKDPSDPLVDRWLAPRARGVEIGPSAVAPFPGLAKWHVDVPDAVVFETAQRAIAGAVAPIDVFASADRLPFSDGALGFVLASHVLEHLPDPIAALREWDRVLEVGGVAFLVVPHKDRTQDRHRRRTPLQHLLHDFAVGMTVERSAMVPTSHYHVWTAEDGVELLHHLANVGLVDWDLVAVEDPDRRAGNGFTLVATKRAVAPALARPSPRGAFDRARVAFHHLVLDLPFQVIGRDVEHVVAGRELPRALDLPRGVYRATPVTEGFPPVAGPEFRVEVGAPVAPAVLERVTKDGARVRFSGRHFTDTTWLEARLPQSGTFRFLPERDGDELVVDVSGFVLPDGVIPVRAVNLAPGGGPSAEFALKV